MKHKTKLITIAGEEFVVSAKASTMLDKHVRSLRKKYILDKTARTELLQALRDILNTYKEKSSYISEKIARESIGMAGDTYEVESASNRLAQKFKRYLVRLRKILLTETTRKRIYLALAGVSLLCIGLMLSTLYSIHSSPGLNTNPFRDTTLTTLGTVRVGTWAGSVPGNPEWENMTEWPTYFQLALFIDVFIMLVLLAYRNKYAKITAAVAVVLIILVGNATYEYERQIETIGSNLNTYNAIGSDYKRTASDLDYLEACGSNIQYVMGAQSGAVFYELRDKGFALVTELNADAPQLDPTRDVICKAYDNLRKIYPNENIVLQSYVKNSAGEPRPFDIEENYGAFRSNNAYVQPIYGFFVRPL